MPSTRRRSPRESIAKLGAVLVDDPSGNPVELFEPIIGEARLGDSS